MGVSSTTNTVIYLGNGSTTVFSFAFYFFNLADINAYLYDTLAGGITPLVLNQSGSGGYSVSGTANAQGFYPNGGTVTAGAAVPSTSYIVITREPPEIQNYSLINSGIISSTALVQQLDYLTLLVQWLQDQVNRCIQLPAGFGPTFSPVLPSGAGIVANAGASIAINGTSTGLQLLPSQAGVWQALSIPYTAFQTAGLSFAYAFLSLPVGFALTGLFVKHSVAFAGTSITDVYLQAGPSTAPTQFFADFDVYQAVGDTAFQQANPNYFGSWANATSIVLQAVSVGANLSALSAGNVLVYYKVEAVV